MVNEPTYDFFVLQMKYSGSRFMLFDAKGRMHSSNGPAMVTLDSIVFYKNGKLHNIDGPAIIREDRSFWYVNDRRIDSWDEFVHESGLTKQHVLANILRGKWDKNPFDYCSPL